MQAALIRDESGRTGVFRAMALNCLLRICALMVRTIGQSTSRRRHKIQETMEVREARESIRVRSRDDQSEFAFSFLHESFGVGFSW